MYFREYKVAQNQFPKDLHECEGYIITGSPKSVYEDLDWVKKLGALVVELDKSKVKLLGICFGHQLIAHFLGGRTEKASVGWGLGVRSFKIVKHRAWMEPILESCSLIMSHQDQVVQLPQGAVLVAASAFCPNEMFAVGKHIFSMQGHPEYTPEFARARLHSTDEKISEVRYSEASKSLKYKHDGIIVSNWIARFFTDIREQLH